MTHIYDILNILNNIQWSACVIFILTIFIVRYKFITFISYIILTQTEIVYRLLEWYYDIDEPSSLWMIIFLFITYIVISIFFYRTVVKE